jgi:hypothetical protein
MKAALDGVNAFNVTKMVRFILWVLCLFVADPRLSGLGQMLFLVDQQVFFSVNHPTAHFQK